MALDEKQEPDVTFSKVWIGTIAATYFGSVMEDISDNVCQGVEQSQTCDFIQRSLVEHRSSDHDSVQLHQHVHPAQVFP